MGALRLETFIPLPPAAEDGGVVGPEAVAAVRDAAYAEGVKAGAAAASAAFEAEKTRLLAPILETLQDAILTRAEARAGALVSLRPLLDMLASTILPPLAHRALIAEMTDTLANAAQQSPDDQLILRLAPENIDGIAAVLSKLPSGALVTPDPTLGPLEAQVVWAGGFDAIDLSQTLNAAQAICARFFAQPMPDDKSTPVEPQNEGNLHVR